MNLMMKCGHRANATCNGEPSCVICAGIKEGYNEVDTTEIDFSERECICTSCKKIVNSNNAVAFFEHRPNEKYDQHYDGCRGWD